MDFLPFLTLIGSVALLIYGMKVMSEGLQKIVGSQLRKVLENMSDNRFTGLLTGAFITTSIQSSTATSVMTVSFINAGLLTLSQAIAVIMGANIGTTTTAWMMTLGVSGYYIAYVAFAVMIVGMVLIYSCEKSHKDIGEFVIGLTLMFLGVNILSSICLDYSETINDFLFALSSYGYGSYFLFIIIGGLLTCILQNSAAIIAITIALASKGLLDIDMGMAIVIGANIGTAVTSNITALSAGTQARRVALTHLLFNVFGAVWVLSLFDLCIETVCTIADCIHTTNESCITKCIAIATFHTLFNICNTAILIGFIKPIESLTNALIPDKKEESGDICRLQHISGGILSTAELSLPVAKKEIQVFAERMRKMFGITANLTEITDDRDFSRQYARVEKYENISDNMELEISRYLTQVSDERLSAEAKMQVSDMMRQINEIESIGDSCLHLAKEISSNRDKKIGFNEKQQEHIKAIFELCDEIIVNMLKILAGDRNTKVIRASYNLENEINHYRTQVKNQNMLDVNSGAYSYETATQYLDIISESEKLCDYVINIVDICIHADDKKVL